jgi:hypothetical protein
MFLSETHWRFLHKFLRYLGGAGCMAMFLSLLCLAFYYSTTRPHSPQAELGWTVGLSWTHPTSYGTAQEESRLISLHWWFLPSFLLIALGEAIRIYILERNP